MGYFKQFEFAWKMNKTVHECPSCKESICYEGSDGKVNSYWAETGEYHYCDRAQVHVSPGTIDDWIRTGSGRLEDEPIVGRNRGRGNSK